MYKNEKLKIDWLNIIYDEDFQNCLELETLKEVSLISRLVREKLKPYLFKVLLLTSSEKYFNIDKNIFAVYLKYYYDPELFNNSPENFNNSLSIESSLIDISLDLISFKYFAKSFYLDDVQSAGYYLFSVLSSFDNLEVLKLRSCVIPYLEFKKLGEKLPNLQKIELSLVCLAKLPSDSVPPNDLTFPPKLTDLEFYACEMLNTELLSDPYKFLFYNEDGEQVTYTSFNLPKISIPSLRKLSFIGNVEHDNGLKEFLENNPILESLSIDALNLNLINTLNSLKSLEIECLDGFNHTYQIHHLEYIAKLQFNSVDLECVGDIKKLCLLCPNLKVLYLNISYCFKLQSSIHNFLAPLLSNLPQLKTLKLVFVSNEPENLDFTKLLNIETLVIKTSSEAIKNLKFNTCNNFKNVEFSSITSEVNTKEFKRKFISYNNWVFKYSQYSIRGYKLVK